MPKGNKFRRQKVCNHYNKNTKNAFLIFRSQWEVAFADFLEANKNIKSWEFDFKIMYFDKYVSQKPKPYYVDFRAEFHDGRIVFFEIKPISSLQERVKTKSMRYKKIHNHNYLKNISKFESMVSFCLKSKATFYIVEKKQNKFYYYRWSPLKRQAILAK